MSDEPIAIGTRDPLGPGRYQATCSRCAGPVYFRDATPMAMSKKMCVECFLDEVEATPAAGPIRLIVTPENVQLLRALVDADRKPPS